MGGKKTVEKSREWEKERRDKLNVGFNDLYKLLPDHDPSISLSKMDILRKAAEYIRMLQEQNEEIIKSGDNDVLRNEADRLKKRVAYLLMKTKELVTALRAAGVPLPNNKKKKKSKAQKVGKDQNHSPVASGASSVQRVPCAVVVGSVGKPTVSIAAAAPLPGKKVKCGCEKAAKKNPLSELNCTSAATTSSHPVTCQKIVMPSVSLPTPAIIGASVQAGIQTLSPTLGPGTLIFRDGRVVTVPPAPPIIPQILFKPQPTLIVMQRAPVAPVKRDKNPLIAPKRREITQTTFANKAPIPAIKTFRLESYPRLYKPKGKKKKEANADGRCSLQNPKATASEKQESSDIKDSSKPIVGRSTSPKGNKLKRKADPDVRKTKVAKATSIQLSIAKTKPDSPEESKRAETETVVQVDNPQETECGSMQNGKCTGVVASKSDSVKENSGTQCLPEIPSSVAGSSHVVDTVELSGSYPHNTIPVHEASAGDKPITVTSRTQVKLDIVEQTQPNAEHQVTPDGEHKNFPGTNVGTRISEGLSCIENSNVSCDLNKVVECSESVNDSSTMQSAENLNTLTSNNTQDYPSQISHASDCKKGPDVEKNIIEQGFQKDGEPDTVSSTLNQVETNNELNSESPHQREISRNENNQNAKKDRPGVDDESNKFPLSSNSDLQVRDNIEGPNCSMEGLEQFRDVQTSISDSITPGFRKTCARSLSSDATTLSRSFTCSSAKPSVTLLSDRSMSAASVLTSAVICPSVQNLPVIPSSGFQSHTAKQSVSLASHPACSLSANLENHITSVTSITSTLSSSSSCPSTMPHASPFTDSANPLPVNSTYNAISHAVALTPSVSSSPFVPVPTSETLINASVDYATSLPFHSTPSKTGSQQTFTKSHADSSVVGPTEQFSFEDSRLIQTNSGSRSNSNAKPSASSTDINQTITPKEPAHKNSELSTELSTSVKSLGSARKSLHHQESFTLQPSSKQLKDMQCSKTAGSMENGSIASIVGASQKRSYTEVIDRTNNSNQLTFHTASSIQSNISTTAVSNPCVTNLTTSGQVYSFGIPVVHTEPSRTESFFNYENPIASIPSEPFFNSFKPGEMPVSCAANTGFGYSTFTTQAPPVRSVARQLFPADPLCSISNSYTLDANLPPLNSSAGQMFQFSSYSNTNSFRDPLLFTNDFLSTPTKNTTTMETLSHEKDPSINNSHNFPDLLHSTASMNALPNIPCSFNVGQVAPSGSAYVSSDFRTISDQPNNKQYQVSDQSTFNTKRIPKSGSDGNLGMNVITTSSESRMQDTGNSSNLDYGKPVATIQNFNFPYLNVSQSLTSQVTADSFSFNMREPVLQAQNVPSRASILQSHTNSSSQSLGDKNFPKTSSLGLNPQKACLQKEFCVNTSGTSGSNPRGPCDVQPNVFNSDATNVYQGTSVKPAQGPNNIRICGNNSQSSNQGVQTQQSYLCNSNPQQALKKTLVPSSGTQIFACSSRANHMHATHYDKAYPKTGQDSLYAVPENNMKITGVQTSTDNADCSMAVRTHKNYQPVTSLPQLSLKNSSHKMNFSSSAMFSHSTTNPPEQSPIISSYPGAPGSIVSQSIYTHPTTAASSQGYSQIGDGHRNSHPNLFRPSHISTSKTQPNQPQYHSNLCVSSSSMIFSTVDSLAQQSLNASHSRKIRNNAGKHMPSRTELDQSDMSVFGGTGAPPSHPNQRDIQTDMMSTLSMSNITGYPSHSVEPSESNSMAANNHNHNQTYSRVPNTKQTTNTNKGTQRYPPSSSHNTMPPTKHCDYPLSSILTGLNDSMMNTNTLAASEAQPSSKSTGNPASSEKTPCNDKAADKQYSTNTEGSSFKTTENTCNADYLRNKENERNFIPIMEDVRLNSEFSNDLFSSLQVPTGGAHADSISPTAAFLLAFPLVSTSKNSENPNESDPQDNNTSTPTTILQIGNIEPSSSEMFHPLEFGKDIEASEYLGHLPDRCKRKDVNSKQKKPNIAYNSYSYPSMSGDYNVHYDQGWSDPSKNKGGEARKKNDKQSKFCGNGNNYDPAKDKKKKSKISVNWMAAPDIETFQKEQEVSSFQANLSFPMDIDALPDLCSSKKNAYSWSPSKSLLPLDSGLVIPSTLPTLVGDLALGTPTPADPCKRCDNSKKQDKTPEKQNSQKSQSNFLSVSQLVDPKSKKKLPDKCKKADKKKVPSFQKRKDPISSVPTEPCMYSDGFLPPLGWDKYRYRNNYSAEALIASQDVNESANFTYQQNPNYFMGSELNQEHHHQTQQYQNSFNFSQNQFPAFGAEDYQNSNFSVNNAQSSTSKRGGAIDKRFREEQSRFAGATAATYQTHPPPIQPYSSAPLPPSSVPASSHPSNFTSSTTTSVTNFNLSTIFPEINERTGSQGQTGPSQQQQQQQQQQQHHHGSLPLNNMSSFQNSNANSNYRTHAL